MADESEDNRTLWVGNLEDKVTEELVFELFLQAGPIERLVFPTEGQGGDKKHKGFAYVVFKHPESVQYSTQVMDGSSLFDQPLALKARSLPMTFKKEVQQTGSNVPSIMSLNKNRFDNNSLRGGFNNRGTRWQQDMSPQAKGNNNFNNRGRQPGVNNYNQGNFNQTGYNNYNNQSNNWMTQQSGGDNLQDKRQRLLTQQNISIDAHRQMQQPQQQMAAVNQMFSQQQFPMQQQQQQWMNQNYQNWNMTNYQSQSYQTDQYGQYYPQQ